TDGARGGVLGGFDRGRGLADAHGLIGAARDGFFVVGVAGVGGHPVVGARRRGAGAVGGFIAAVGRHRHGAVAGDQAAFGRRAALVVIELEGDRAAHVFAEGAGQRGLVLEGVTDGARGGVLGGFDRGRGLADAHGLIGAARDGFFVVGVAGVGGHPVVGARRRGAGAVGGFIAAVGRHRHGAVAGDQAAFGRRAALVVIELEGDRAAHVFAEGAGQRGLVLEGVTDGARGGVLGGFDRGRGLADAHGLIGAARDGFFVVGVAGVGGHPVVGARRRGAGAVGGFIAAVGRHRHGAVAGDHAAFGRRAALVVIELEGDRAAHVFAEGAGQRGLVLEGVTD